MGEAGTGESEGRFVEIGTWMYPGFVDGSFDLNIDLGGVGLYVCQRCFRDYYSTLETSQSPLLLGDSQAFD